MTKSLKTADGKYWVGDNINPSDFLLIKARMYAYEPTDVTFVVEKSELDKIPNSQHWSVEEKAQAFVDVEDDISEYYQYDFKEVVIDPTEIGYYLKGYNHTVNSITVIPNANEKYEGAVGKYEFTINSKNSNMYANGGQPRGLKGKNFSDKIENNQKFKKLINTTFNSQSSEHKYPEEFIKAIALTDKALVKNEGSLYIKGYTYSGTLTHFEFMDLPSFKEALEFVDRPKPQNFKFEDGGAVGVGGTMDTSMDDAPMIGGTMESSVYAKGGLIVTSIKDIPNFQQRLNEGRITYRGLGMGKVSSDFYNLAGESGTRIKVDGKEYYITDTEFNTFSRGADGRMRIKFDAPHRSSYAKGGAVHYTSEGKLRMKKMYDTMHDYLSFAKVGDVVWLGDDTSNFQYAGKSHLWKVQEVTPKEIIVSRFGRKGNFTLSPAHYNQKVIVVGDNTYAKGGTVKTNKRTLDKIANVYFDLFDVVGAESGGELRENKVMLEKFSKLLEDKVSKIIAKKSLSEKDFDYYEDNNYHLLNEFLSWNDYFATNEFKDMYKRLAKQYKRSNSTLADPKYIVVKTVTVAPTAPVMADPTPLATPTEATLGKPNYKVNAQIKSVKFTTKSGKTKTVSGDMVLNGAHYFKKGGSVKADYEYFPKATVVEVTLTDGSKLKPLNGYWVSKTVKFGMGGGVEKFSTLIEYGKNVTKETFENERGILTNLYDLQIVSMDFPRKQIVVEGIHDLYVDGEKIVEVNHSSSHEISNRDEESNYFKKGGGVKPFEYTANGATVYINGTKADVKAMYLDYVNNFLTIEGFADYYGISDAQAKSILKAGKDYADKDGHYAEGGQLGDTFEVVVVSKEADKDGGRKHKDRFLVSAETRAEAIAQATKMWKSDMDSSDLSIVEVLTADEYREKYLKPKFAEGGNVGNLMSFEEFKKTMPVLHDMIVLDNSVEYKPMYDKYSGTTKYFRHGRRNLLSFTLREAYEHYEYFASKGKEYAKGGRTRQYEGLNEQDKFIADQIYHVIGLSLISEKKNVIKNSILANLDIYNLEKNPKRIVKDNLEYALTLKSPSAVNNTMEATINALRSSVYAKGGVADDFKNFFGGIGRTIKSGYEKTRDFTNNQVHAQKKRIALEVIDDTKDKVRSNRDKMDLKGAEEIVEDYYADGGMVKKPTKAQYESYLNGLGTPSSDHPDNGGRVSRKMIEKYGTWLRKNDPIAFEVGYNEFRAQ